MNNKTIKARTGMPLALRALTISAFDIGTTEFQVRLWAHKQVDGGDFFPVFYCTRLAQCERRKSGNPNFNTVGTVVSTAK